MIDKQLERIDRLQANIEQVLFGKPEPIRLAIVVLLARGHLLIEDIPGVGKTTLAQALARSLGVSFQRIQFTSDMLPSDILGVSIYDPRQGEFEFKPGPLFANIILADEINRTTPKTQSSLLEAMNDFQVSVDHHTYPLPHPFMVMATQNPMEYHGTHPLPESQMDRFLLRLRLGYPDREEEKRILRAPAASATLERLHPVLSAEELLGLQEIVERVRVEESLADYLMAIVEATRRHEGLTLGVSPRGALALYRAAQALALIEGRDYCIPDDVKRLALPVLAHRVLIKGGSIGRGIGQGFDAAEQLLHALIAATPIPD
ncbi:MAG: AAA family ATPase [Candidatus Methylomirabilaceae bacterium]